MLISFVLFSGYVDSLGIYIVLTSYCMVDHVGPFVAVKGREKENA